MRPLRFVNWASVAARFTVLMWALALVLACVVLTHLPSSTAGSSHGSNLQPRRLVSPR
jgi:hypothetical protein